MVTALMIALAKTRSMFGVDRAEQTIASECQLLLSCNVSHCDTRPRLASQPNSHSRPQSVCS